MPERGEGSQGVRVTYGTTAPSERAGILPPHGRSDVRSTVLLPRRSEFAAFLPKRAAA